MYLKLRGEGNKPATIAGSTKGLLYGHVASRSKLTCREKNKNQNQTETNMRKSILDQFAVDAINAPETVTGGRRGRGRGRTRTRTRGNAAQGMIAANRRGRTRTRTRHG